MGIQSNCKLSAVCGMRPTSHVLRGAGNVNTGLESGPAPGWATHHSSNPKKAALLPAIHIVLTFRSATQ